MVIEIKNKNNTRTIYHHSVRSIRLKGGLNNYIKKIEKDGGKVLSVTKYGYKI